MYPTQFCTIRGFVFLIRSFSVFSLSLLALAVIIYISFVANKFIERARCVHFIFLLILFWFYEHIGIIGL